MAERVRARRLSDEEGRRLQQIVRRGKHGSVRVRRALMIIASARAESRLPHRQRKSSTRTCATPSLSLLAMWLAVAASTAG